MTLSETYALPSSSSLLPFPSCSLLPPLSLSRFLLFPCMFLPFFLPFLPLPSLSSYVSSRLPPLSPSSFSFPLRSFPFSLPRFLPFCSFLHITTVCFFLFIPFLLPHFPLPSFPSLILPFLSICLCRIFFPSCSFPFFLSLPVHSSLSLSFKYNVGLH